MGFMDGRGARGCHGRFELHDGRLLAFGMDSEGWWASLYRDGRPEARCEALDLHSVIEDVLFAAGANYVDTIVPLKHELGSPS